VRAADAVLAACAGTADDGVLCKGLHNGASDHDMSAMTEPVARASKCPICGRPAEQRFRPFCSRRCADVDLSRWLSGTYAIPAVEDERADDEAEPDRD
jgi:endogenous inhibitor of DNA gyrase (YacG/DUF329 family)